MATLCLLEHERYGHDIINRVNEDGISTEDSIAIPDPKTAELTSLDTFTAPIGHMEKRHKESTNSPDQAVHVKVREEGGPWYAECGGENAGAGLSDMRPSGNRVFEHISMLRHSRN